MPVDDGSEPMSWKPGRPVLWLIVGYVVLQPFILFLLGLAIWAAGWKPDEFGEYAVNRARTVLVVAGVLALVLVRFGSLRRLLRARLPIRAHHRPAAYALVSACCVGLELAVIVAFLSLTGATLPSPVGPLPPGAPPLWFKAQAALFAVLVAPIVEELTFRGVLTEDLRVGLPDFWPRSLVIAGVFAFMHDGLGWFALVGPVLFSLWASHVRERTGSLGMAVLVHASWNAAVTVVVAVAEALGP